MSYEQSSPLSPRLRSKSFSHSHSQSEPETITRPSVAQLNLPPSANTATTSYSSSAQTIDTSNDATSLATTLDELYSKLEVEFKIAEGASHLLQLFENDPQHSSSENLKLQVEGELSAANDNIGQIEKLIEESRAGLSRSYVSHHQIDGRDSRGPTPEPPLSSDLGLIQSPLPPTSSSASALGFHAGPLAYNAGDHQITDPLISPKSSSQRLEASESGHAGPSASLQQQHLSPSQSVRPLGLNTSPSGFSYKGTHSRQSSSKRRQINPTQSEHHQQIDLAESELPDRSSSIPRPRRGEKSDARSLRRQANALLQTLRDMHSDPVSAAAKMSNIPRMPSVSSSSSLRQDVSIPGRTSEYIPQQRHRHHHWARTNSHSGRPPFTASSHASGSQHPVGDSHARKIDLIEKLVGTLKKAIRVRYELDTQLLHAATFPCLADSAGTEVRAATYRLLRHTLVRPAHSLLSAWKEQGLDLFLTRSLLRDNRCTLEKEQALRLFRAIVESHCDLTEDQTLASPSLAEDHCLTEGMVRAVVATSENNEDKMKDIYLETLVELSIHNFPALIRGGGLGTILNALLEGPPDLAPATIRTMLAIADRPSTRCYLTPATDLEVALSGYTDLPAQRSITYTETLQTTANIVTIMLSSWTGLMYLCMNDHAALKSVVVALRVSPEDVQESIIAVLVKIFDAGIGAEASRRSKQNRVASDLPEVDVAEGRAPQSRTAVELRRKARERTRQEIGLVDQYLSLLLVLLIDCGLVPALVHIFETSPASSRSATLLMGTLLQVGNRVLPQAYNVHFHQLPRLFSNAARFQDPDRRQRAITALSAIDRASLELQLYTRSSSRKATSARERADSITEDSVVRGNRQVEKVKMMMGMNIDDNAFRAMLLETQVQTTRDHTKWNLEKLFELVQGPLLNVKRLEEALRLTKLIRRLLSFFHPSEGRFCELPATPPNRIYIRLGCTLLTTLIASAEGVKFVAEDKLLREIREAFDQIDPQMAHAAVEDPVFAKSRITSTLSQGYFDIIGTLSASTEGVKLLNRFGIWTALYRLCQQGSRDDLLKVMLEKLDYTIDGHPRILLGWTLSSGSRPVRRFATEYLTRLIRRSQFPGEWMIGYLLVQLCDPAESIRGIAVAVVKEVCSSPDTLEMVVSKRPTLDHLGETGHELLLRFLSTPGGLRYLLEGDYIDREMEEWFNVRNHRYAVQMEVNLSRALSIHRRRDDADLDAELFGPAPPHFYGELAKTPDGCEVLNEKGHFLEFSHFIRHHGMESTDLEILAKLKSVLWAVGNIGSTPGGFPFLEINGTVANIVDVAENSPVLSVRGVCFYVIGLISLTRQGAELLQDYGWQSAGTTFGKPIGICLPQDLGRFCELPSWKPQKVQSNRQDSRLAPPSQPLHRSILSAIANLGNSILANKASRTLTKMKQRHPQHFAEISLFAHALALMDRYRLRQVIRRFIFDLFDIELNTDTIRQLQLVRADLMRKVQVRHDSEDQTIGSDGGSTHQRDDGDEFTGTSSMVKRHSHMDPLNPLEDAALADADEMFDDDDEVQDDEQEDEGDDEGDTTEVLNRHVGLDRSFDASDEEYGETLTHETTTDVFADTNGGGPSRLGGLFRRHPSDAHLRRSQSAQSNFAPTATGELERKISKPKRSGSKLNPGRAKESQAEQSAHHFSTTRTAFSMFGTHQESSVYVDGFGERKGSGWTEPPKEAPAPGVRIIGGFGQGSEARNSRDSAGLIPHSAF
ncbi:unnamed protein product [Sympodiomycopsis kandeliae]